MPKNNLIVVDDPSAKSIGKSISNARYLCQIYSQYIKRLGDSEKNLEKCMCV